MFKSLIWILFIMFGFKLFFYVKETKVKSTVVVLDASFYALFFFSDQVQVLQVQVLQFGYVV